MRWPSCWLGIRLTGISLRTMVCAAVAEVLPQDSLVALVVQVEGVLHIVPGREVGEYLQFPGVLGLSGQLAGHGGPRLGWWGGWTVRPL